MTPEKCILSKNYDIKSIHSMVTRLISSSIFNKTIILLIYNNINNNTTVTIV